MVFVAILGIIDLIAAILVYVAYGENILALVFAIILAVKGIVSLISAYGMTT